VPPKTAPRNIPKNPADVMEAMVLMLRFQYLMSAGAAYEIVFKSASSKKNAMAK
jgi:hypothetical protein